MDGSTIFRLGAVTPGHDPGQHDAVCVGWGKGAPPNGTGPCRSRCVPIGWPDALKIVVSRTVVHLCFTNRVDYITATARASNINERYALLHAIPMLHLVILVI